MRGIKHELETLFTLMSPSHSSTTAGKNIHEAGKVLMRMTVAVAVACLTITGLSAATETEAAARQHTDIPAQGLGSALRNLARNRGFQIVFASKDVSEVRTQGAVGEFTTAEALNRILSGTGLIYRYLDDETITIVPLSTLEETEVRAAQEGATSHTTAVQRTALTLAQVDPRSTRSSSDSKVVQSSDPNDPNPASGSNDSNPRSFWQRFRLAQAQTRAPESSSPSAEGTESRNAGKLEEIIVTARKRDERQIDVPIALSTKTGAEIEAAGLLNVSDIIATTPGTTVDDAGGAFTFVQVRGVTSGAGGNDIGYYLDELAFTGVTLPLYPDVRSFDLDRVEVLRGPQGTLFGEGSIGGTIRVITQKPQFNAFRASVDLTGSSIADGENGWGAKGMVNIPLVDDKLALRLAATEETQPGWVDNTVTGQKDVNQEKTSTQRAKLRYAATDRLTFDLAYWKFANRAPGGNVASKEDRTVADAAFSGPMNWDSASAVANYALDGSQLTYVFGDGSFDFGLGRGGPFAVQIDTTIDNRSHELRWASAGAHQLDWTVGYYQRKTERKDKVRVTLPFPPFAITSLLDQTNDSYSIFGETTWNIPASRWALTAGVRYFNDKVNARDASVDTAVSSALDTTFNSWNPRVSVAFKPVENTTFYASAARGFRSGLVQRIAAVIAGPSVGIDVPSSTSSDSIWSYELGAKTLVMDNRLQLEGAVFYSDWKDTPLNIILGGSLSARVNTKGSTQRGVEFNVSYLPFEGLALTLGGAYIEAEYKDTVPGAGIFEGDQTFGVPKTAFNGSAGYTWPLVGELKGVVRGSVRQTASQAIASAFATAGDPLTLVDARIGVESSSGWATYLYGDNLADEKGAITGETIGFGTAAGVANRLRPRTVGIELRYNY